MAGLVPLLCIRMVENVDARHKAGHDNGEDMNGKRILLVVGGDIAAGTSLRARTPLEGARRLRARIALRKAAPNLSMPALVFVLY